MKKVMAIFMCLFIIFYLTGCGMKYPGLEKDSIGFYTGSYIDENDDDAGYITIEYNERIYMPYGILNGTLKEEHIHKCIGYIIQDNLNDKDTRIYTLIDDKNNDFLMEYYIGSNLMNNHMFYRAVDTNETYINIPQYIEDLEYNFWK